MAEFRIGENQPIVGERAFTCTTGIHQNNLEHLGHTAFQPSKAGREWTIALNRHSSRKAVLSLLQKYPQCRAAGDCADADLVDAIYSYLSYQLHEMDETAIRSICDSLLDAYSALRDGGILIAPTNVGYTLITNKAGAKQMKSLKGRPDDKPCGVLGIPEIYKSVFGTDPPLKSLHSEKYIMGHLGKPPKLTNGSSSSIKSTSHWFVHPFIPADATGPNGEVGIWLNNGPVVDYLARRLWSECGDIIVASSCNMAGAGNPESDHYDLAFVNSALRNGVDLEIDIPHWESPQLDEKGRWLSAPVWEIGTDKFIRKGRDQDAVAELVQQKIDVIGNKHKDSGRADSDGDCSSPEANPAQIVTQSK